MESQPRFFGRLLALIHGEVPAAELEAYRKAGRAVYELLQRTEDHRLEHKVKGDNPWGVDPAHQAMFLCAWNAFLLQTLGDKLLEADYAADPSTVGFVPPVTQQQAMALYTQVEPWLSRATQAESNPAYRLDRSVPAELPAWVAAEPCPRPHLEAMLAATRAVRTHAEAALAVFEQDGLPPERQADVQRLRQIFSEALSKSEYAQGLLTGQVPQSIHEVIESHLKAALEGYYRLGQLLAMPELLAAKPDSRRERSVKVRAVLPGDPGFDPWVLTDPRSVGRWKADPKAGKAIQNLWASDPDPERTLAVAGEIQQALLYGDIEHAGIGHYYCCPWSAVFEVKRPVTIGGVRLQPRQQFTYDVSAEGMEEGEPFKREVMIGDFRPTSEVDYCDPRSSDHRD